MCENVLSIYNTPKHASWNEYWKKSWTKRSTGLSSTYSRPSALPTNIPISTRYVESWAWPHSQTSSTADAAWGIKKYQRRKLRPLNAYELNRLKRRNGFVLSNIMPGVRRRRGERWLRALLRAAGPAFATTRRRSEHCFCVWERRRS